MRTRAHLALPVVAVMGCVAPTTEPLSVAGRLEDFAAQAQPTLAERCANPSCHGTLERPLSLYARHRHRLDPDDLYVDRPLAPAEVEHNFLQASQFVVPGRPEASPLLRKPLAVAAGGDLHAAVDVFIDVADPGHRALAAWVAATGEPPP